MEITSGIIGGAQRVVLYGPEGIGKTSFAACLPDPVFIDTEGSTVRYNVRRLPAPESWPMLLGEVEWCIQNPEALRTLAVDTADWAERLCIQNILAANKVRSIEDFGYGKGYVMVQEEFGRLLNLLTDLTRKGVHVILTAHAYMRKFEQPDEFGAYDRWELKLSKKVAPMVKEWSDMLLFANYETYVVRDDKTNTAKAQGGRRVMFTTHNPCWDAKNRENFPDKMDFDYYQIARCFETIEPDQSRTDTLEGDAALTEMNSTHGNTSEGPSKPSTEKAEDSSPKAPEGAKQAPAARNSAMPEDGDVVKDSNSCLLTHELQSMSAGLKVLKAGIRDVYVSDFQENFYFSVGARALGDGTFEVVVSFYLPNTMDGDDTAEITCTMDQKEMEALIGELDRLCEKFPDRT